jgi:uncharacterized protein
MNNTTICIYHGNCADGFSAAWVVRKAFENNGEYIDFYPGVYQEPPPEDIINKNVIFVDFCYKRPIILEMAEKANSILIIDHHKSAVEDLIDLPDNVVTKFDIEHSGAMLTWIHFFPGKEPPQLLKHIEDRDLWKFELPNTRAIQATIFSYPYDFDIWDQLMESNMETLVNEGIAIERKHFKDMYELIAVTRREMVIGGIKIPVANLPYTLTSDAGYEMAEGYPFAACYWDTPGGRVFSLRSREDGIDVSEIAKQYGGGGHKHAAGFRVDFLTARMFEV